MNDIDFALLINIFIKNIFLNATEELMKSPFTVLVYNILQLLK